MPAISKVDICNRALQKVGAKRISALTDQTPSARAVSLAYDFVRRSELRKRVWNFTITRTSIAADSPAPDWGRQNSFTLPSDFIRLADSYPEQMNSDNSSVGLTVAFTAFYTGYRDWVIEQNKVLTNDSAPLQVRYVKDVTDPTLFDSIFSEALATAIAYEICEELSQSNTKKEALLKAYMGLIDEARLTNSIEVAPAEPPADTFLTCRS